MARCLDELGELMWATVVLCAMEERNWCGAVGWLLMGGRGFTSWKEESF